MDSIFEPRLYLYIFWLEEHSGNHELSVSSLGHRRPFLVLCDLCNHHEDKSWLASWKKEVS
jgi:hypothetical protein